MKRFHRRGTGNSRMRWHVAAEPKRGATVTAAMANELPLDFNPAVPGEQPLDAASLGDGIVNLWFPVPLYCGFSEERRLVLRLERGRFRM